MKLTIDITRDDYADFNKFHLFSKKLKRMVIIGLLTIISVQLLMDYENFSWVVTLISSVICIIIYFLIAKIGLNATRNIPSKDGAILGEKDIEFTEDNIYYKAPTSEGTINWTAVKKFKDSKKAFYLYMDTHMALVVPKRFFKDGTQEMEFRDLVNSKINLH